MKTKNAISLIVLVITIIILAILATTVIVSIIDSGIINKATDTVKQHDLSEVRNLANLAWAEALTDNTVISDAEYQSYVQNYLTNAGVDTTKYDITASAGGVNVDVPYVEFAITKDTVGVTFTKADGVTPGDPDNIEIGDIVIYGDYEYRYNVSPAVGIPEESRYWLPRTSSLIDAKDGWSVILRKDSMNKTTVDELCGSIYGMPLVEMTSTFLAQGSIYNNNLVGSKIIESPKIPASVVYMDATYGGCDNLTRPPVIPANVTYMHQTFAGCIRLTSAPIIPSGVTNVNNTFYGCTRLDEAPVIPSGVETLMGTFAGCTSLTSAPIIPSGVTIVSDLFKGCTSLIEAPMLPSGVTNMNRTFERLHEPC